MSLLKYVMVIAVATALAACGGGGGSAGNSLGGGSGDTSAPVTPAAAFVEVLTSSGTLLSSGVEIEVTAFVKNSSNVGLAGQAVKFSASSGTLQGPSDVTDGSGAATAKLIVGSDKSLRDIKVTVSSGTASGSVSIPVVGTRVSIAGEGSLQAGGAASQYTVRAVDSLNNPIPNVTIGFKSALGNALSSTSQQTDSTGSVSFLYTPNIAGSDKLTASGLGTSSDIVILVNAIDFKAVSPASNTSIPIGTNQTISVRYQESSIGIPGKSVVFTTSRGTFAAPTGTTDANGDAVATITSTTAGPATIVAQIAGVGTVSLPVLFVATTPSTIVVQSNPGAVLPNISGTANRSTIEAVVRDANGNAVANRQVNFTTLADLSNGTLSPGTATTDLNGRAAVQFIPGATSTAANGVQIQAEVASTSIRGTTQLTVNGQSLFITIAFGNEIGSLNQTTYSKEFSVYVTDANGVAVGNQLITLSAVPNEYYKGRLLLNLVSGFWEYSTTPTTCSNEDNNLDGILDAAPINEDRNGDGQLTPGNIALVVPGNVTTDTFGRATFALQYGEQFAPWARVRITARANVAGTESRQAVLFSLVGSTDDFKEPSGPAGVLSPFGQSGLCTNAL